MRDAFRVAQEERPGPVHLELPEDIAGEEVAGRAAGAAASDRAARWRTPAALDRAAAMILQAERPLVMLGAAGSRPRLADALSDFVRRTGIPFFNTQMGKGAVAGGSKLYMGTAALSERDYVHEAIDRADLIIAIGHDTVEKPPFLMGPDGPKVIHVGYHAGQRRGGLLPACRGRRRCRAEPRRCWPTGSRASCRTPRRCCRCARRSSRASPTAPTRAASR